MAPMSSVALLLVSQFVVVIARATGRCIARIALPAILLMEVLGAVIATVRGLPLGREHQALAGVADHQTGSRAND